MESVSCATHTLLSLRERSEIAKSQGVTDVCVTDVTNDLLDALQTVYDVIESKEYVIRTEFTNCWLA